MNMYSFSTTYLEKLGISPSVSIIYGLCAESKGKQELWEQAQPEVLTALQEKAIISSTESSNRIEGVEIDSARLRPLVAGKIAPQSRPEEEVLGYKKTLDWIHSKAKEIEISPEAIQQIHTLAQSGSISDAGQWKKRNNEIIELKPDGSREIRFVPTAPEEVPRMMSELCLGYKDCVSNGRLPDALLVASFVFDFLCIHPFRDGNGRVSRLLSLLLLYQHGYEVGRFISLEKIVEDTKDAYYSSLKASSQGWHKQTHSLEPFWKYFLTTIRIAYEQLGNQVTIEGAFQGGKTELIRKTILAQTGKFKLSDIANIEKIASKPLIKKVLYQMRDENLIQLHGTGRGAYWSKKQ